MCRIILYESIDKCKKIWYNRTTQKGSFFLHDNKKCIGGRKMRVKITLACSECKQRNYDTMKNKKNDPDRIEMNKYCRFCKKHTLHKETK